MADSCLFPALNDGVSHPRHAQESVDIDGAAVERLILHCQSTQAPVKSCLATIWAVILGQYTDSDRHVMGFTSSDAQASDYGVQYVIRLKETPTALVQTLNEADGWEVVPCPSPSSMDYNTGIWITETSLPDGTSLPPSCDIQLAFERSAQCPRLRLEYRLCALSRRYAVFLKEAVSCAVESVIENQHLTLKEISTLQYPAHFQQIQQWNANPVSRPSTTMIHTLIHQHSIHRSAHVAINAWDERLTYAELDMLSSRLSLDLQSRGLGPGALVATCFGKSAWAVVALLAINKAGCGFVPLEPTHPEARIKAILQQTEVSIVLVDSTHHETVLKSLVPIHVTISKRYIDNITHDAASYHAPRVGATDTAYCLFTSGSTGAPRGCLMSHAAFTSIANHSSPLQIDSTSRTLQFASMTFGISLIEIWCTLSCGGTLCIPSEKDRNNRLAAVMREMEVNWALMTPTTTQVLQPANVPALRTLVIAGEPLPKAQADVWASSLGLFQAYGLTEWAGICAVSKQIKPSEPHATIGHCAGGRLWLVSPGNAHVLAPIGAEAELLVEGPSLALGYLNEPQRTAECFIAPPQWYEALNQDYNEPQKLYKTGDIVRYRSDGSLEYLCRRGTQVKLRAQRIELEEVEYHIAQSAPDLKRIVVEIVQPKGSDSQPTLAAFLYPAGSLQLNGDKSSPPQTTGPEDGWFTVANDLLRSTIKDIPVKIGKALPSYMVPQLFLPLRHLPVTTSGKVNRRQLRDMIRQRDRAWWTLLTQERKPIIGPETDAEVLVHTWVTQVLKIAPEHVGMSDDFFTSGGDSALAMKLVGTARRNLVQLQVIDVVSNPILADLARVVEERVGISQSSTMFSPPFHLLRQEGMSEAELKRNISHAANQCGEVPENVEDMYPCTPMQESLMTLSSIDAGLALAVFHYQLQPDVEIDRLKTAWQQTVDANPILRSRIANAEGNRTMQVILNPHAVQYASFPASKETLGTRAILPGDELVTAKIRTETDGRSTFVITIHHAICDRWSMTNIMRHVERAYCRQRIHPPPSFASFVTETSIQRKDSRVRQYWREQLASVDAVAFPSLPTGYRPLPDSRLEQSTTLPAPIPQGATASNLLRLAWAIVIAAHTSHDDVLFGTIVSGRGMALSGIEEMTGPTIANVSLRIQLRREEQIDQALTRLGKQFLAMIPNEQVGMQTLSQDEDKAMAAACKTNHYMVVQPYWEPPSQSLWTNYDADSARTGGFSSSALTLTCWLGRHPREIRFEANFDEHVIPTETVSQLLDQLQHVLHQAVCYPHHKIHDISVVTDRDMKLLERWNARTTPLPPVDSVGEILHLHVSRQPNELAVSAWDGDLTYRELDVQSSFLAKRLISQGATPHGFIPILLGKTKWTPVAIWATIKISSAFTLLDPTLPIERLQVICTSLQSQILISSSLLHNQAATIDQQLLLVDAEQGCEGSSGELNELPNGVAGGQEILYVVFTSGSTGKPKGVVIDHRAFCASAFAQNSILQVGSTSRFFQNASHAFDITMTEILSTLLAGGCVCIPSQKQLRDEFVDTANRLQITHLYLTPPAARTIDLSQLKSLRCLMLGGESIRRTDASWLNQLTYRVVHSYGPAECSVTATGRDSRPNDLGSKSIGFPLGCRCWVVNTHDPQRLAPIGVVGELIIEGPIVGQGYLRDPERTAQSFIPQPGWLRAFGPANKDTGAVYRTGDLVRWRNDGSLDFVGRQDLQVKIRGQRIEIEEVEKYVQHQWSFTGEPIVGLVGLGPKKTPSLVAFIGPDQGAKLPGVDLILPSTEAFKTQVHEVKQGLERLLPPAMIPTLFLAVREIPLSATSKINRAPLCDATEKLSMEELQLHREESQAKRSPVTSSEKILCKLWASILGISDDSVGLDDNFFRLGGDSLSAVDLVGSCREHALDITVSEIFSHPTLEKQAEHLRESSKVTSSAVPPPYSLLHDKDAVIRIAVEQCHIPQNQIEDIYPCTPLQEGLLALTARDPEAYIGQWIYRLPDGVDLERLRVAWDRVAQAHPILRTRMAQAADNRLYQVVCRISMPWRVCNAINEDYLENIRAQMTSRQFQPDLVACPAQKNDSPRLVITMHHASYDQISLSHLLRDVHAAYQGQADLVSRPFSPLIRYIQEKSDSYVEFWKEALAGYDGTPFPDLPAPDYRPVPSMVLERQWQLGSVAAGRSNATFTTKMYLAWAIVQSRYQRSEDVVFGVTISGRSASLPGVQHMTGPTIATIPLRLRMSHDQTLSDLLQMTQDVRAAAIPHEQTGILNIGRCGPAAAIATQFQTLLVVQQVAEANPAHSSLLELSRSVTGWTAFTSYPLLLTCTLSKDSRVSVQASFDPKIISPEQTDRALSYFEETFELLQKQEGRLLRDVPNVSRRDYEQIMRWNSRPMVSSADGCVHCLIVEKCLEYPTTLAVCAWDGTFTYAELDELSSSLADLLITKGVSVGTFVPLYFEKSRWTTVAILAVMKAGGAFVLLDPSHPTARLQDICEQLGSSVLVASEKNTALGSELCSQTVTVGDHHRQCTDKRQTSELHSYSNDPNRALYAVFTSGSTGKPKGVVIEHNCYVTSALAHIPLFRLTRFTRVLQFSAYAFDVSIIEHLSILMVGGCVCVPSDAQRFEGLADAVETLQPNYALLTPSFARSIDPDHLSSLEVLVLGGERIQEVDVQKWAHRLHLISGYGPAECSVVAAIQDSFNDSTDPSNIGFSCGGTCWVLDPDNPENLSPIGVPGELVVESNAVARGYLGLPNKTAEVFISPPSWLQKLRSGSPKRLYKTGDLVKYAEDGSMIFVGRKDTQVKLRGQRMELSEVETRVLQFYPSAADVIAEVFELNGSKALVAFVSCPSTKATTQDPDEPTSLFYFGNDEFNAKAAEVQSELSQVLPGYMVPSVFLPLTFMPRSPSGKADRRRLRETAAALSHEEILSFRSEAPNSQAQEPLTDAERILQSVWGKLIRLPLSSISATDQFFRLGGDSITAMKAAPMARDHGLNISVADIFDHPRLCDLARLATEQRHVETEQITPFSLSPVSNPKLYIHCLRALGIAPTDSKVLDIFPATAGQSFFLTRRTTHFYNFTLTGQVDVVRLKAACSTVFDKHSILRTLFTYNEDQAIQTILTGMKLPFHNYEGITNLAEFKSSLWAASSTNIDILPSVPTQFILLSNQDGQRHEFMIRLMHAQWDALSLSVLYNDIALAYNGQSVTSSTDFSDFLRKRAQQPRENTLKFWSDLLKGSTLTPIPTLPGDTEKEARLLWTSQDVTPSPQPPAGITMASLVKAAWAYVLWETTSQEDITFVQTVNGRGLPLKDADRILGCCLNFIPVRVQMQHSTWKVRDLLQKLQDQHSQSLRHDTVQWSDMVEHSTSWPKGTEHQSIVQHQNFDYDYRLPLDGLESSYSVEHNFTTHKELFVFTYPMPDRLTVEVCISSAIMSEPRALYLLGRLCSTIELFAGNLDTLLCDLPTGGGPRVSEYLI
ncbi:nonribosomal peptide synthase [Penicillium verrucosum]|uniref:nonribosomal peptide synthase n=1 Tax=Penicillium verrucosum TaxID=60171 RepID=UPI0025458518|nr:nonribosomal peptide synthase [Penicillium verrucosum]KAJ5940920.1 nonribosomal peptide synthase [Penicillium verrucosum]